MRQRGPCLFISIEAGRSPAAENIVRAMTRRVRSDVALRQRRAGMRRVLMTTVFEARDRKKREKFNSHIVAVMPDVSARDKAINGLNGLSAYVGMAAGYSESSFPVFAEPVTKWAPLTTYLAKEATPQAAYRKGIRRVGGSIPLGARGGDRVVLSRDLRAALEQSGKIEPYRRTYAKRLPKAQALLSEIEARRDIFFDEPLPLPSTNEARENRAAEPVSAANSCRLERAA